MPAITLTEANFDEEVSRSPVPVLVTCRAESHAESVDTVGRRMGYKHCQINAGTAPALAKKYKIQNTPTVLLFKGGKLTDTIVGSLKAEQLLKILQ